MKTKILVIGMGRVTLESRTVNPLLEIVKAYRHCRNSMDKSDSRFNEKGLFVLGEKDLALVQKEIEAGHTAPLEFASFSFEIGGISKVADRQLVRNRIASYAGNSGRVLKSSMFYIPASIKKNKKAEALYKNFLKDSMMFEEELQRLGIPLEDARYASVMASTSSFLFKMNVRALRNFLAERLCSRAQTEIRQIAEQVYSILKNVHPVLVHEVRKCGKCPNKCHV